MVDLAVAAAAVGVAGEACTINIIALPQPNPTSNSTPPLPQPNLNLNLLVGGALLCLVFLYPSLPVSQVGNLLVSKHNKVNIDSNITNTKV